MLKRRVGIALVALGVVSLVAALLLFSYNEAESESAGQASDSALAAIQNVIYQPIESTEEVSSELASEPSSEPPSEPTELTYVEIDGERYVGYISIPALELELPVMGDWSMARLAKAPCLQYGSPFTNDAVIAGHNYKKHFRPLHDVVGGEQVFFVDMTGYMIEYSVVEVRIIDPTDVYEVINSEFDLILYTCTTGGQSRVIVCCDRI